MNQEFESVKTIECLDSDQGKRLDKFLSEIFPERTRSSLQKLLESGNVLLQDKPLPKNYKLKGAEMLVVQFPMPRELTINAQDIPLEIVYEDADLLVVNKPKGMVVHPAPGNYEGTLVNALLCHCGDSLSGINGVIRPGIVHRIDKDTSGLLMVAKNDKAHLSLAEQIKGHSFLREYEAVVYHAPKEESGAIDLPIGRSKVDRKKMCVTDQNSKPAVTYFEVLERFSGFSHLRFRLKTGRTHQIRVHMAYLGCPVAGDPVYGPKKVITSLQGQCLHAKKLGFIHPTTKEWMEFDSPLPEYFQAFLRGLGRK